MKYLIAIALLFSPEAHAFKILYNATAGDQRLEDFGPGGSTSGQVVWNESKDGPVPANAPVGYAARVLDGAGNPALVADSALKAAKDARDAAAAAQAAQDAAELSSFLAIKSRLLSGTQTQADLVAALKFIVKRIGN